MSTSIEHEMLSDAQQQQKSALQVRLLKGPLYRAKHKELWQWLDQMAIRAYFQQIGLSLLLDG
ncbi:hypothetical protein AB4347_18345 [Vibrio breoganii]|uniref:hypothetical protein n=1 Tax=Vibrio breoganii TaxID=553239 RepID=UPI000C851EFE|nr:hypothetical protein [Vibrio breoganii]PMF76137.1 hypothetical protein BCV08_17335 [Vibrio breoganii]